MSTIARTAKRGTDNSVESYFGLLIAGLIMIFVGQTIDYERAKATMVVTGWLFAIYGGLMTIGEVQERVYPLMDGRAEYVLSEVHGRITRRIKTIAKINLVWTGYLLFRYFGVLTGVIFGINFIVYVFLATLVGGGEDDEYVRTQRIIEFKEREGIPLTEAQVEYKEKRAEVERELQILFGSDYGKNDNQE